ncbi:MAG: ribosome biogenesis GTPase Der [Erysipelothrix sp.]|nr:ribosome biogenesis GTPase Der [Erysipelothrix sp.]
MIDGIVAIVGRSNVGKSSFFNRVIGERVSIVEDTPGVTRDRVYGKTEWLTKHLRFIDTGGIQIEDQPFQEEIKMQVEIAINEADVIVFLTSVQDGLTPDDRMIARMLHDSGKPVVVAVNKVDSLELSYDMYEFYALGFEHVFAVSSAHGIGMGDTLDKIIDLLDFSKKHELYEGYLKFAIIGQPNVGKSMLINSILNEDRVIVSPIEGTTRDAIDTPFQRDGENFVAIDTAGIRKRGKVYESVEKYSVLRSLTAIERADVILFVIDGEKGIRQQDKHVAGYAHNEGKPVIIIYNKWDTVEKDDKTLNEVTKTIRNEFVYLSYAPILFVSAKTKQRVNTILPMVKEVYENATLRVSTSVINEVIMDAQLFTPPPTHQGQRLRIYYSTQVSVQPTTFVLFVNDPELCHFSYKRYLENRMREAFDFTGVPIKLILKKKSLS